MKRVFVTGNTGVIARYVCAELLKVPQVVLTGTGKVCKTREEFMQEVPLEHVDLIIHLAAWTDVANSDTYPDACWTANVELTEWVCQVARQKRAKLLVASTIGVESIGKTPAADNTYYRTKAIAEGVVKSHAQEVDYSILRFGNVFGCNADGKDQKFVGKILAKLKAGETPTVVNAKVAPVYAGDIAKAIVHGWQGDLWQRGQTYSLFNGLCSLTDYYDQITASVRTTWPAAVADLEGETPDWTNLSNSIPIQLRDWQFALHEYIWTDLGVKGLTPQT